MRRSAFGKELLKVTGFTILVFIIIESLLRLAYFTRNSMLSYAALPYVMGYDYPPVPPWIDGLRILQEDETLIWKNRPSIHRKYLDIFSPARTEKERTLLLRQFFPTILPKEARAWEMSLNSQGFRNAEFSKKTVNNFRILCLGDSWTFGTNVDQAKAYPQQLNALLKTEFPNVEFEVLNLGVLGYSSYHGLRLLQKNLTELKPDVVVIAYAMNEPTMAGYRHTGKPIGQRPRSAEFLEKSELYRLLRYWAQLINYKPQPMARHFEKTAEDVRWVEQSNEKMDAWLRASLNDYERYHRDMIDLARREDIDVILLYNELRSNSPYFKVLKELSAELGIPLVDSSVLIAEARRKIERDLEAKLGLRPSSAPQGLSNGETEIIFRVFVDQQYPVSRSLYVVGSHHKLGDLIPNTVRMYDDATHGDQKAGDHVWSLSVSIPAGTKLFYVYTNSGQEGQWQGLDVPDIRKLAVNGKNTPKIHPPIDTFGKVYMQADSWHTDALGYYLIAKAVFDLLMRNEKVNEYLHRMRGVRRGELRPNLLSRKYAEL
jgi:lysophospholipase L1-like esterase